MRPSERRPPILFLVFSCIFLKGRTDKRALRFQRVFGHSMCRQSNPLPYSQKVLYLSVPSQASLGVSEHKILSVSGLTRNLEDYGIAFRSGRHL